MNKVDQTGMNELVESLDQPLKTIEESCPRLLYALQASPEAVWGEILRMESACQAFKKACFGLKDRTAAVHEITALVGGVRGQMAKHGLMNAEEFAAFRDGVSAIQHGASRLRNALGAKSR